MTPPCPGGVYKRGVSSEEQQQQQHSLSRRTWSNNSFFPIPKKPRDLLTECRRPTDLTDTPCVITHRRRCIRSTRGVSARRRRSLPAESRSPSTRCSPSRRGTGAAAAARRVPLTAGFCLSPDTWAYPWHRRRTSSRRTCCTRSRLDIRSTAARRSPTSRRVVEPFTHKVT